MDMQTTNKAALRKAVLPLLSAAWLAFAAGAMDTAAAAEPSHEATTVVQVVHTNDLDLTRAEGLRVLAHRLHAAAHKVCDDGSGELLSDSAFQDCYQTALADANRQMSRLVASARSRSEVASTSGK